MFCACQQKHCLTRIDYRPNDLKPAVCSVTFCLDSLYFNMILLSFNFCVNAFHIHVHDTDLSYI